MGIGMSYELRRACPGCGKNHTFFWEGRDTPSTMDRLYYTCPVSGTEYVLAQGGITVWQEEFSVPEGSVVVHRR